MRVSLARLISISAAAVAIALTVPLASSLVGPRESRAQSYARSYPGWWCTATGGQPCVVCPADPGPNDYSCSNTGPGAGWGIGACTVQNPNWTCWIWTQYCGGYTVNCTTDQVIQTDDGPCNESPNYCTNQANPA